MLTINIQGQPRQGGTTPHPGSFDGITDRWLTYQPGSLQLSTLQEAIQLIRVRILVNPAILASCNRSFESIHHISFSNLVTAPHPVVVISYNFEHRSHYFGVTEGNHISIAQFCYSRQPHSAAVLTTAATLVHELAHVAGAPGVPSRAAERTLPSCGFADQYDSTVVGELSIPQLIDIIRTMA
jgi:hypothetical protein